MKEQVWELPQGEGANFAVTSDDVPGTPRGWSVASRTLSAGVSAGVQVVEVDNGRMKLAILPTRGMGLWRAEMNGEILGWRSPLREPVHPHYVPLMEPSGAGWLDGFNELMARCGLESNGAPVFDAAGRLVHPLHGRIANKPAHSVRVEIDADVGSISVIGVVDEFRFHFQKLRLIAELRTSFGGCSVEWHDRVVNCGGQLATMQMLYHINIGTPLLAEGTRCFAPIRKICPKDCYPEFATADRFHNYQGPGRQTGERVYLMELHADGAGGTQVLVEHPETSRAVAIAFNVGQLPWLTQWQNLAAEEDGYVTGIEPATNFPNARPFEEQHGRIVRLAPGAEWEAKVAMHWLVQHETIAAAEARIAEIQGARSTEVHDRPLPDWSATAVG